MARSRRTPEMLVGRCSWELFGRKPQRKIKSHKLRANASQICRVTRGDGGRWRDSIPICTCSRRYLSRPLISPTSLGRADVPIRLRSLPFPAGARCPPPLSMRRTFLHNPLTTNPEKSANGRAQDAQTPGGHPHRQGVLAHSTTSIPGHETQVGPEPDSD
jgi:hypothetical protein